ncbi:hypothetical protein Tco_0075690, partial [Tanacetum coccineum]
MSEGHFIRRLAAHFGLVSDEGLRGLSIIGRELLIIDLHKLARPNIRSRFGDTWDWVVQGPERQQAGALRADEDAPVIDEGAKAILAPVHAPQLPPPTPKHRTMSKRIERLEEE